MISKEEEAAPRQFTCYSSPDGRIFYISNEKVAAQDQTSPHSLNLPVLEAEKPPRKRKWCYNLLMKAFPHIFFATLMIIYALIGAAIFSSIEGRVEKREIQLDSFLSQVWIYSKNNQSGTEKGREMYFIMMSKRLIKTEFRCEWLHDEKKWTFLGSLFFCCTVFTTVGYGEMYPITNLGKSACVLYALFGIPLMFLVMTSFGDVIASILCKIYNSYKNFHNAHFSLSPKGRFNDRNSNPDLVNQVLSHVEVKKLSHNFSMQKDNKTIDEILTEQHQNVELFKNSVETEPINMSPGLPQRERSYSSSDLGWENSTHPPILRELEIVVEQFDIPLPLIAITVFAYISLGAAILPLWETEMDYGTSFYFCFITFTTIGFGDIWLKHDSMFLFCSVYTIIGIEIFFTVFKLLQFRLEHAYQIIKMFLTKWEVCEPVDT